VDNSKSEAKDAAAAYAICSLFEANHPWKNLLPQAEQVWLGAEFFRVLYVFNMSHV
jgi:hypothetical protein